MRILVKVIFIGVLSLSISGCSTWYKDYGIENRQATINPQSTPKLIAALKDKEPSTRKGAVSCLMKIGTPEAFIAIKDVAQNDDNEDVRIYANNALKRLWYIKYGIKGRQETAYADSIPNLIESLSDKDPWVRKSAIGCLQKIANHEATEAIEWTAHTDDNEDVRNYAQRALSRSLTIKMRDMAYDPVKLSIDNAEIMLTVQPKFNFFTGYKDEAIVRKAGLLPINIKLINLSDSQIFINPSLCELISPDGKVSIPLVHDEIIEKVKLSYKGSIISTVIFAPVGIAQMTKNRKINAKIENHIRDTQLGSCTVGPHQTKVGCVFMSVPNDIPSFDGWKLNMGLQVDDGDIQFVDNRF